MTRTLASLLLFSACCLPPTAYCQQFDRIVIDNDFPGAYQVEVADINGDKKPDIVALGGGTCAWYENPTWIKRIITGPDRTPGIITSATADLDGDGKAEIAIGYEFEMNEPKKGKLGLAVQGTDGAWTFRQIADVGSIHRIRWADLGGPKHPHLVVAPIFGPDARPPAYRDPATLMIFYAEGDPITGSWAFDKIAFAPVLHAIDVIEGEDSIVVLIADNFGAAGVDLRPAQGEQRHHANIIRSGEGAFGQAPNRGSSEIHAGRLKPDHGFVATIEPWHGSQVVIYDLEKDPGGRPPRLVVDDTLDAGHALWVADIDGDGDSEVFAGHRGKDYRVSIYKYNAKADRWDRTVIDRDIAAQDLRGGDLDGDDTPDVVAVGGSTHNVVWYRPKKP